MELVRIFRPEHFPPGTDSQEQRLRVVQQDLKETIENLVKHLFQDPLLQTRWVDAYFPFTTPSFELEIFYEGEWMEVLGCGVIHPTLMANCGRPQEQVGWAAGLGLERFAMNLFKIPDIRLFWSEDPRFTCQFRRGQVSHFEGFSKYPACYKDVSFWEQQGQTVEENDVMEIVRD